ncbi:major facilitator family transporter [Caballeronia catudaia]|uniref:Major facilitator family transporter n=1 Tax=Caballeronia catudaia TaxID=1777136 RepID=A0A158CJB7_9BURK|nr:hypothetical protein [Caballeronia catudaia]SAK81966.1 major facilitator family transporter [Caballeronia catudaia]
MTPVSAATLAIAVALLAPAARNEFYLIVIMVLLDLGNRAGFVANQARIYALRPEARNRLNTIFMVSYYLGGAARAALGGYGARLDDWIGLAVVGAVLSLAAAVASAYAAHAASADRPA